MEEAIEGEVHLGPQDVDIAPIHGHLHQSGMIQGLDPLLYYYVVMLYSDLMLLVIFRSFCY